jgi:hypothetical protein
MQADTPKARAAYQDFLTLGKEADSDIPILKQAKTAYPQRLNIFEILSALTLRRLLGCYQAAPVILTRAGVVSVAVLSAIRRVEPRRTEKHWLPKLGSDIWIDWPPFRRPLNARSLAVLPL